MLKQIEKDKDKKRRCFKIKIDQQPCLLYKNKM